MIKVPQSYPRYQTSTDQSPDTQRILNEIQRINVEFGYVKKEPQISPRIDLESYFYPRPAYHPIHQRYNNGMVLPPTIRQLNLEEDRSSEYHPFNTQMYFYPTPHLQVPYTGMIQLFQRTDKSNRLMANGNMDNDLFEYAPQFNPYGMHRKPARDYNQEKALIQAVKKIVNEMKENNKSQHLDTAVIIDKFEDESRANRKKHHQNKIVDVFFTSPVTEKTKTRIEEEEDDSVVIDLNHTKEKFVATTPLSTTIHSKSFFNRQKPTNAPPSNGNLYSKTTESPPVLPNSFEAPESENVPPASVKGPFSNYVNSQKEQVLEALRHSGIIIQKLRVREGGIAIAGPGK